MPDYQQTTIAGTRWKRACRINIENPRDGGAAGLDVIQCPQGEDDRGFDRVVAFDHNFEYIQS